MSLSFLKRLLRREPFSAGDHIIHAAHGHGIVTGTEPDGIVVARMTTDNVERRFMADYAPIKKAP